MKKTYLATSLIAATILMSTSVLATNGYFGHGYSTKEKGMAGAGVAYSQDSIATATNPAGIAGMSDRFDIGIALFSPQREYEVTGDPMAAMSGGFPLAEGNYASDNDVFLIPNIGATWALSNGDTLGVSVYGNGGMDTEYNGVGSPMAQMFGDPSITGTYGGGVASINLMQAFLNVTYAAKVDANHALGVSVIGAVQSFRATGLDMFSQSSTDHENLTDNGRDYSTGLGVKIGWQGNVADSLTLGASYQSEIRMSEFDKYAGLFADGGDFDIPATATIGLAWNTSPSTVLVLDVQQIYYSDVTALNNGAERLADVRTGCLGAVNGAGFGWDDMTVYKVGYEFGQNTKWRVGASYGEQPIREGQNMFNILAPAVVTTHYTAGFTTPIGTDQEISVAGMYAPSNTVSGAVNTIQTVDLTMDQYEVQVGYALKF